MKSKTLYIVRHGETEAKTNPEELGGPLVSGSMETHLTKKGKEDMEKIGENYKDVLFDIVFVSPRIRSRESAEAFLKGAKQEYLLNKLIVREDLSEINYGLLEGVSAKEVAKIKKDFFESEEGKRSDSLEYKYPGIHPVYGEYENFREGAGRYDKALKDISSMDEYNNILIISHSGVMRALQLCGKITSAGAEIGKDLKFGEVIKLNEKGELVI